MKEQTQGYPAYKKDDVVQVISGKYKGKSGKVLKLLKGKGLIIVEKVNVVKRHTKPNQANPQGGIIEKEAPFHVCKVLPVSAKTGKPMRLGKWLKENPRANDAKSGEKKSGEKKAKSKSTAKGKGAK